MLQASRSGVPDDVQPRLDACLSQGDDSAVYLADALLSAACEMGASDLHVEPLARRTVIRFRIDGLLHEAATIPADQHARLIGRLKVLARLLTYQKDLPQDGRIDMADKGGKAMRVSTFPTVHGEKAVMRVLDTDPALFSLDALGFPEKTALALRDIVSRPYGTLLLTGPASSGKTTTIYALLAEVQKRRASSTHIVTLEDPVEYRLDTIAQTEITQHNGFTFDAALRAVLRLDPEVIMLGEIRDVETARASIQAGLTGHLVISTIHSGTAPGVFTRLLDMGVEPFLIASSITGVLAQRLVRRVCPHCAAPYNPPALLCRQYRLDPDGQKYMRGEGCADCRGIGYRGRLAIGELLGVSDPVAERVLARCQTREIAAEAVAGGMTTLAESGRNAVLDGYTTVEELARLIPPQEG